MSSRDVSENRSVPATAQVPRIDYKCDWKHFLQFIRTEVLKCQHVYVNIISKEMCVQVVGIHSHLTQVSRTKFFLTLTNFVRERVQARSQGGGTKAPPP